MTLILRFSAPMSVESIPLIGALAVARSINGQLQIDSRVRWPNDVVVDGSKVAGSIAEGRQKGQSLEYVLLGIGVNGNFELRELRDVSTDVTTLMELNRRAVDTTTLVCNILLELEELLSLTESDPKQLFELLRMRDYSTGRTVKVFTGNRVVTGVFVGYHSLDAAGVDSKGERVTVPASSAVLVEYLD